MADSFITQCPHCGTSFRVRNEQLAVANGSVRCGACLQVFSARNHVVTTAIPAQKPTPAAAKAPPAKAPATKAPATAASKPKAKPAPSKKPVPPPPQDEFQFKADDDDDAEFLFEDSADDFVFEDNADDDNLFDEDEKDDGFGELSDSFLNLSDNSTQKTNQHFQQEKQEMEEDVLDDDTPDESWAESMLEEIEKTDNISLSKPAVFEPEPDHSTTQSFSQSQSAFLSDFKPAETAATQVVRNASSSSVDLEFSQDDHLSKLRPLGWLLCLLLIATLAAQAAWYFRDTYARMDQWRGLYQQACYVFGCELPEQRDLSQVRTSVIVREHKEPSLSDLRIVDVVLTNKAPFKQPFPELRLTYSDVNGKVVADQSFLPQDYLKGELTGVRLMPINTRVYISFPIQKPVAGAVNYNLTLHRVEP